MVVGGGGGVGGEGVKENTPAACERGGHRVYYASKRLGVAAGRRREGGAAGEGRSTCEEESRYAPRLHMLRVDSRPRHAARRDEFVFVRVLARAGEKSA